MNACPVSGFEQYQIYFPAGTYFCNTQTTSAWPTNYQAHKIFVLPNGPVTLVGDGSNLTKIVTPLPVNLFDGFSTNSPLLNQFIEVRGMTIQCTSGYTTAAYAFAFVISGPTFLIFDVVFQDWSAALRYPDGLTPLSNYLSVSGCVFNATYSNVANADVTFGFPIVSILGGGLTTILDSCIFQGISDPLFTGAGPHKGIDGLIKTINQCMSLSATNCVITNHGEEALACDGAAIPGFSSMAVNFLYNHFVAQPAMQGGTCAAAFNTCTGRCALNAYQEFPNNIFHFVGTNTVVFS